MGLTMKSVVARLALLTALLAGPASVGADPPAAPSNAPANRPDGPANPPDAPANPPDAPANPPALICFDPDARPWNCDGPARRSLRCKALADADKVAERRTLPPGFRVGDGPRVA